MGIYLSVSSKTRAAGFKELGVSNKSRELQKVYVGVGGKARLVYMNQTIIATATYRTTYKDIECEYRVRI